MKSYEALIENREKRERNTVEDHLKDISTSLAMLCDRIDDLNNKIDDMNDTFIRFLP